MKLTQFVDQSARLEILLREYQEAGEVSRSHAILIRTGLTLLSAVQAGVIGFIATRGSSNVLALRLLAGFGMWLSVVAFFSTNRLVKRYSGYMERASDIEKELGMTLYRESDNRLDGGTRRTYLRGTYLWPSVPVASFLVFSALLVEMVARSLQ